MGFIRPLIRPYDDRDAEAVVDFSLRAWEPVFAALEQVLGSDIFPLGYDRRTPEVCGEWETGSIPQQLEWFGAGGAEGSENMVVVQGQGLDIDDLGIAIYQET